MGIDNNQVLSKADVRACACQVRAPTKDAPSAMMRLIEQFDGAPPTNKSVASITVLATLWVWRSLGGRLSRRIRSLRRSGHHSHRVRISLGNLQFFAQFFEFFDHVLRLTKHLDQVLYHVVKGLVWPVFHVLQFSPRFHANSDRRVVLIRHSGLLCVHTYISYSFAGAFETRLVEEKNSNENAYYACIHQYQ